MKDVEQSQRNNWNFSHCCLTLLSCGKIRTHVAVERSVSQKAVLEAYYTHTHTHGVSSVSWFVQTVQGVPLLCYAALCRRPPVSTFQSSFVALKCQFEPLPHAFTQTTIVTGNQCSANRFITNNTLKTEKHREHLDQVCTPLSLCYSETGL